MKNLRDIINKYTDGNYLFGKENRLEMEREIMKLFNALEEDYCTECGEKLTKVRPGKTQCDNEDCSN